MSASYRDLVVWQKSIDLALAIYAATERFPRSELYGLTSQMRRAATSVASNIAEGHGRRSAKQRYSFLENSLGSIYELETQLVMAGRLQYIDREQALALDMATANVGRGLNGLLAYVAKEARAQPKRHLEQSSVVDA
jgi:four helix bundle protein